MGALGLIAMVASMGLTRALGSIGVSAGLSRALWPEVDGSAAGSSNDLSTDEEGDRRCLRNFLTIVV